MSRKWLKRIIGLIIGVSLGVNSLSGQALASGGQFSVSPMNQKIVLTPGEKYSGSFQVTSPDVNKGVLKYRVQAKPFKVDNDYNVLFENNGNYNKIVDWTTIEIEEGTLEPNETQNVRFTINVPEDAPAGGQYVSLSVRSINEDEANEEVNIKTDYEIAHMVFAEILGETKHDSSITDVNLPGIILNPPVTASARTTNKGNVHAEASYKLQVFPLFSNEEVYTNEESPDTKMVLPESSRTHSISWKETPSVGIFKVLFTVEFDGVTSKTEKIVLICPIWLLFIVLLIIFAIVFWLVTKSRKRKKA